MDTLIIVGQVYPKVLNITIAGKMNARWEISEIGKTVDIELEINKSTVKAKCTVAAYEAQHLAHYLMRVSDLARASVNLVAFAIGFGVTVLLHTVVTPDGTLTDILVNDTRLQPLCTAYGVNTKNDAIDAQFGKVQQLVLSEPALFMALDDLIVSITIPHHATVNCARAIEGLKKLVAAPGGSRADEWAAFRSALNLERSYIEMIIANSIEQRHGNRIHITGNVVTEVTKRSWVIMNRFLEYRLRGSVQLPLSEFPLLA